MLPGSTVNYIFYIKTLGSVLTADSMPNCVLIRGGIDTVVSVSVSQLVDNSYSASFTIPSNWSIGETIQLRINAVVNGLSLPSKTINLGTIESAFRDTDRTALLSAQSAALAVADGRQRINYLASTFTIYNADGSVRRVFNLRDQDNNAASSAATAVERIPQ